MAKDHRRVNAELVQEAPLDDPSFLRKIVERVVQQILVVRLRHHLVPSSSHSVQPSGKLPVGGGSFPLLIETGA
jgi:hypothetical protein